MNNLIFGFIPCPSSVIAQGLARQLLTMKLIACANIIPSVRSLYWWEGALAEADEVILIIKTLPHLQDSIIATVTAQHPYSVPCIVFYPLTGGNEAFLTWARQQVLPTENDPQI